MAVKSSNDEIERRQPVAGSLQAGISSLCVWKISYQCIAKNVYFKRCRCLFVIVHSRNKSEWVISSTKIIATIVMLMKRPLWNTFWFRICTKRETVRKEEIVFAFYGSTLPIRVITWSCSITRPSSRHQIHLFT